MHLYKSGLYVANSHNPLFCGIVLHDFDQLNAAFFKFQQTIAAGLIHQVLKSTMQRKRSSYIKQFNGSKLKHSKHFYSPFNLYQILTKVILRTVQRAVAVSVIPRHPTSSDQIIHQLNSHRRILMDKSWRQLEKHEMVPVQPYWSFASLLFPFSLCAPFLIACFIKSGTTICRNRRRFSSYPGVQLIPCYTHIFQGE